MRYCLLIFVLLISLLTWSNDDREMRIGIYRDIHLSKAQVSYVNGAYDLHFDSSRHDVLNKGYLVLSVSNGKCLISINGGSTYSCDTLRMNRRNFETEFHIKPISPSYRHRAYLGDIMVTVEEGRYLKVVNNVPLKYYLAGVIESESGAYRSKEYYKVQAIISRTYALKNKKKHIDEGFMLTDLTNCQVYKSKCRYSDEIIEAVEETDGLVIVDSNLRLITAAFYSNSGGQTANSEDVWNRPLPYLRSVRDPYSAGMRNYAWRKVIPVSKWLQYLKTTFQYPVNDSLARAHALTFKQYTRKAFFVSPAYGIPLRDIRRDWRLKSAFFSLEQEGSNVIVRGRGFGHGVGLSQEGAMNMVKQGFTYDEIIRFYFTGVEILSYDLLRFYTRDLSEY